MKEIHLDVRKTATVKIGLGDVILYANDYILEVLGYNLTEFVTQRPKIICSTKMPDIIHDSIGEMIKNFEEGIAVLQHKTKNGDYFWAFTHFKPVYKPDGTFEAFLTRRKPIPSKRTLKDKESLKEEIEKLYTVLKEIEVHSGLEQAKKYLDGFLEDKGFESLKEYYESYFDFDREEIEKYFSIDENTPERVIRKFMEVKYV